MRYFILVVCLFGLFFGGCASRPRTIPTVPNSKEVATTVANIQTAADDINTALPTEPAVMVNVPIIKTNTASLYKSYQEVQKANGVLSKMVEDLNSKFGASQKKTLWLITLFSGLAVGVFIVLFVLGKLPSIIPAAIALAIFLSAMALSIILAYMLYIAIACGVIVLGIIGYAIFKNRDRFSKIIKTVDEAEKAGAINWDKFSEIADEIAKDDPGLKKLIDSYQVTKDGGMLKTIKDKIAGILKKKTKE